MAFFLFHLDCVVEIAARLCHGYCSRALADDDHEEPEGEEKEAVSLR